jgi:GPI mannosyltransferase 3
MPNALASLTSASPTGSQGTSRTPDQCQWERRLGGALLFISLTAGAGIRAWLAFHDDGIYWPDEIYQSLEPAHRLAFGYGMVAWEFVEGARSWLLPGGLAGLLKLSAWLGFDSPRTYLPLIRLAFSALSLLAAFGSYRLATAYRAPFLAAALGAALCALAAPVIYFSPRAMSETASAPAVVWGLALLLHPNSGRANRISGSSLLALAVLLRIQNIVFCIGILAILAARRNWRIAGEVLGILVVWALLGGLLDKLTWGGWFHSSLVYLKFNLVEGRAAQWGVAEFGYYARVLWTSMPTIALVLALLVPLAFISAPGLELTCLAFLLLHSLIPHKELRFVLPVLPVLFALAGIGASVFWNRLTAAGALLVACLITFAGGFSAVRFHRLTFGELGQYEQAKPDASAYDDQGDVNRLLLAAHELPDLCGLKVEAVHPAWTGGFTYLHRNVPLYPHTGPPRQSMLYNYVLTTADWGGGEVAKAAGRFVLLRLPWTTCAVDLNYSWRLP